MNRSPATTSARRLAWLLLPALLGLFPLAGCDCTSNSVVTPVLPPLSAVVIAPAADTVSIGGTADFKATAYDTNGVAVAFATFAWTSSDTAVFSASSGRALGKSEGTGWVFAEAGGFKDSAFVAVLPDTGWFRQASSTTANLNGVFFNADGRRGWAVGDGGTIVHTTAAGTDWSFQVSHTTFNLNGVFFTSALTGWAVGNFGTVLKTTDGGINWGRMTLNVSEGLQDVFFTDANHGWIVGSNGAFLRTADGGKNWAKGNLTAFQLNGVAFSDNLNGWAVGQNGVIFGSDDGGLGWTQVTPSITNLALKDVSARPSGLAWAAGAGGAVPRTVLGLWAMQTVGASNQLEGVYYPTDLTGYAVGANGAGLVMRSDDGGVTWQPQTSHTAAGLRDVFFVDALRGWAVGDGGVIIHTSRGGTQ
jgi:photosystem II stability/assembly factor-like uncharacterized protein